MSFKPPKKTPQEAFDDAKFNLEAFLFGQGFDDALSGFDSLGCIVEKTVTKKKLFELLRAEILRCKMQRDKIHQKIRK